MIRRYHLHLPGVVYAGLAILVGIAAVNRQNNLLFWILGMMLAGLLISGLVSGLMMQGLRIRRLVAGHGTAGEPLAVRYAVTNRSRVLPAFGLHIEERPVEGTGAWNRLMAPATAWVMHVGPRETVHGETVFWPAHRGEARFGELRVWTTFPFGIIKKSITIRQPQHVLIYPVLYELRRDLLRSIEPRGLAGSRTSPRTGAGDEYYGMREFRPGDSMRQVAWKRSACLDQLVCLERTQPAPPRLRVIVNLTAPTEALPVEGGRDQARRLEEQAISLAASIIRAAEGRGFEVGLSLPGIGRPELLVRRGHWHHAKMLSALAAIDLNAPRAAGPSPASMGEQAAQVVVHPDRVDPALGREDAMHFSARQLDRLAVGAIGWDPNVPAAAPRGGAAA